MPPELTEHPEAAGRSAEDLALPPSDDTDRKGSVVSMLPAALKRRSSSEIMRSLPEKLRSAAEHAQHLADNALLSFVIINAALQRSSALCKYVVQPDVQKRMGANFRVGMGFGLHAGCASSPPGCSYSTTSMTES